MPENAILLYDGECGFCDRSVQFVLRHDRRRLFRFAPLQTEYGREKTRQASLDPDDLSTMMLVLNPDTPTERVLTRGRAALTVLKILGRGWTILSWLRFLPKGLLDWGYNLIAKNRFRISGRLATCRIPTPEERDRFIGL